MSDSTITIPQQQQQQQELVLSKRAPHDGSLSSGLFNGSGRGDSSNKSDLGSPGGSCRDNSSCDHASFADSSCEDDDTQQHNKKPNSLFAGNESLGGGAAAAAAALAVTNDAGELQLENGNSNKDSSNKDSSNKDSSSNSNKDAQQQQQQQQPLSNLYVSNLSVGVDNDLLFSWFRAYGPLVSACVMVDVHTGRSRGYGFVQFESEADGEAALKGLNGKVCTVPADNKQTIVLRVQRSMFHKGIPAAASSSVFLRNIPNTYDSTKLLPILAQFGEVERIQLFSIFENPKLLKACVEYKDKQGALNAVNALHRKLLDPTCKVALACRFADGAKREPKKNGSTGTGSGSTRSQNSSSVNSSSAHQQPSATVLAALATATALAGSSSYGDSSAGADSSSRSTTSQPPALINPIFAPPSAAGPVVTAAPGVTMSFAAPQQQQQQQPMMMMPGFPTMPHQMLPPQQLQQKQQQRQSPMMPQQQQQFAQQPGATAGQPQFVLVHLPGHAAPIALPLGPNGTLNYPMPPQQQPQQNRGTTVQQQQPHLGFVQMPTMPPQQPQRR